MWQKARASACQWVRAAGSTNQVWQKGTSIGVPASSSRRLHVLSSPASSNASMHAAESTKKPSAPHEMWD
ncbi:hypothetical protein BC351_27015 [Paenibacillus ferrarius]|uniref:Uncharacterized protein n=1 Tax=Paenibacillus ferrarius TaxID=1469647 RepID=A0A1V4HJ25_9BACL|nr:hypothetical protein [Paenibacillus ferrarius]OPH56599.1 hypothetical protein BC351_27015 [Paenibacillus ferrarius]